MSEENNEEFPTQEEQEQVAKIARWPELAEEPEIDNAVVADVEGLIKAQMAGEEDG